MKKHFLMSVAALACGVAVFTSCSNEDNTIAQPTTPEEQVKVLTFEDADWKGGTNFAGQSDWSSLIDAPQYNGAMLYPADFDEDEDQVYFWYDEANTELYSELVNAYGDGAFWAGGIAVSNYIDADLSHNAFQYQLAVPKSNGSKNFAVVFCNSNSTINPYNPQTTMSFKDGKLHVVQSMKVGPTTYQLAVAKSGNGFAKALTEEGDYFTLTIHGLAGDAETGTVTLDLARDGKFLEDWTTVDLTSLGEIDTLMFTMDTNDASYGYANQPTYFAFDDVTVRADE